MDEKNQETLSKIQEIREFINTTPYPHCKIHQFTNYKYFCGSKDCPEYLEAFCEECAEEHKGHLVLEINNFYEMLLNDIIKQAKNNQLNYHKQYCFEQLQDVKKDCKILLNLISILIEEIDITCKTFNSVIKKTKSPVDIIIENIEKSVKAQDWKERTLQGINERIQNINQVINLEMNDLTIYRETPQIQNLSSNIDYFTQYTKEKLLEANQSLEKCFAFTSQRYGKYTNKKIYDGKEYQNYTKIFFEQDSLDLDLNQKPNDKLIVANISQNIVQNLKEIKKTQILHIDLVGNWNKSQTNIELIKELIIDHSPNLKYLWVNLNGWEDTDKDYLETLCMGVQNCKQLQTFILNIQSWGMKTTQKLDNKCLNILTSSLKNLDNLECLSLWIGYWNNISDAQLQDFLQVIQKMNKLQQLDLGLDRWASDNELITNQSLKQIFQLPQRLRFLQEFHLSLNRWGYKNQNITIGPFKNLLQSLNQQKIKKFSLSMLEAYNIPNSEKKEVQYMIKGILKEAQIIFNQI